MAMFIGYFEVSVNFDVENRREKFRILNSIFYPGIAAPSPPALLCGVYDCQKKHNVVIT